MAINLDHVTEQITVTDAATNASLTVQPKGTGAFNIAAGSSGLNLSNGGTVTALTLSGVGYGYTTQPSAAITAPTTAGGVQATATVRMGINTAPVASGGTGYTVGDVLTVVGGTPVTTAATLTVSSVSGGVITGVNSTNFNSYTVLPVSPVSVTGGTGSGATFNPLWFTAGFTITNAGSGYVEQPTVTFSGGGGSGAAAYATVGGTPTLKTLGSVINFSTPGGIAFSVADTQRTTVDYWQAVGSTGTVGLKVEGSSTNNNGIISSKGNGFVSLYTNAFGSEALRATHTASAVNYVNITGAATTASPIISAQGSDAVVSLNFRTKGTGSNIVPQFDGGAYFQNLSSQTQFLVSNTASAVNYVQVTGAATGGQVFVNAAGSDSNIGIGFTAKLFANTTFFAAGGFSQFQVGATASAVNYFQAKGGATGFGAVLSAQGSDTNIPAVVQPKGTGALQAQQTDSTATGGNARGANAVDWQTLRSTATKVASGSYSVISGGQQNTASGTGTFVGGGYQNACSAYEGTVVGGSSNTASNFQNFIGGGSSNNVSGSWAAIVGGFGNTAAGYYNFIGGGQANSGTSATVVTTQSATMAATTAVTLSAGNANIKVGQTVLGTYIASNTYVSAISGTALTLSQVATGSGTATLSFLTPHGVVVGGGNNQATGSYSFIGGGGDAGTAANRNVASGAWSTVGGGWRNTASGLSSFIGGGGTYDGVNGSGNVASGIGSFVASGWGNNASSNAANAIGVGNVANGQYSTVIGYFASAKGIIGNIVFGANSAPLGQGANQSVILVLAKQTTDATATVITSDGAGAGTTNQVILPNNSAYFFTGEVVAGVTGGGNTKGWTIEGVIKRGANAASTALVGTPTVTSSYADAGASTWTIAVTADTTNGGLAVTFTGQLATTIRVVCQVRTTEMTY